MSVVAITNGMTGAADANVLGSMPSLGLGDTLNHMQPLKYIEEPIAPKLMPMNIDVASRRNVLPCKGITHQVLRSEPSPAAAGMIAPTGIGRHQPKGLSQERPTMLPIMPFSDPFASEYNNPLKAPA